MDSSLPSEASPTRIAKRQGGTEKFYIWTILVLAVIFVLFAIGSWHSLRQRASNETSEAAQQFAQMARAEFSHQESMLKLLGRHLLHAGALSEPARGRRWVEDMLRANPAIAGFGLARPDGQLVLVSGIPAGRKLPNLLLQAPSREGFLSALKSTHMVVGRTYYFPLLERWLIPVRLALRDANGKVLAVMAAGIDVTAPGALWNVIRPRSGIQIALLRDDGYLQLLVPLAEERMDEMYAKAFDWRQDEGLDPAGRRALVVVSRLPESGLSVVASYGYAEILRDYASQMTLPAVLFLAATLLSFQFYRMAVRRQQRYEETLIHQATHDALTGMPNRLLIEEQLHHEVARAMRSGCQLAIAYLDVDNFKQINDSYGHPEGDRLLQALARRLKTVLREVDIIGRMGGDEFVILLPDIRSSRYAELLGQRLLKVCEQPFELGGHDFYTSISVGSPDDGDAPDVLMSHADAALYRAKESGRNTLCFFDERFNQENERRLRLANALRQAEARGELDVVYQPKVRCGDHRWVGAEALMRWHSEELGEVSPLEFIAVAEDTGQIEMLGQFLLRRVVHDMQLIHEVAPEFRLAVNVSMREFRNPAYVSDLLALLHEYRSDPALLELEVTESIMADPDRMEMELIRQVGLQLAIDDFGTGFSSLSTLKRLPVSTLKLDRAFVPDLETDPADRALIKAMLAIARELQLDTVAEGVESEAQARYLCREGCTLLQGYHFSQPIPLDQLLLHLRSR
ncbi:putative bifunctional diguanylate cyclase/phosphodiesterase [endosymbiont of unidentified scaly snail isolate Monju]|uniref:putative bifunctional diguanylate cyclase/phosphodiesterase n=1 Tax=endosymbiont of unidentified scaly snail isolate Monju TaxID=1248727 RepID=UPI00038922BE|nr:EAL domain-containing protein [endosymbiont of unidentified scaly snail isolate Monju]BAN69612.1 signal transduction protein [endosymbiont of unidentified scaly snail isolate Monju]